MGIDAPFQTPFGERLMVYCDYTASCRSLHFIENYLIQLQRSYANTHTEDDITGRRMTQRLHEAEQIIKGAVNAGPQGRIIACGTGSTGAIDKFQQLVGIACPPATRQMLYGILGDWLGADEVDAVTYFVKACSPVVFVGPYEHHSNEVTWREGLATVVKVQMAADGSVDLAHLEALLQEPAYQGRLRIGSFSAASNVTGMISPVHEIARLLHCHGALACFDFAASGPYVHIDMTPPSGPNGGDPSLDAVFISPHKFLGGPGSSGVLIFNERIYQRHLAPSVGGGGTVDYVGYEEHDFTQDIEQREKAGTPGALQTMKASLAFQVKQAVTVERIEAREQELLQRACVKWQANPNIEILGNPDPARRLAIVSFNVRDGEGRYLHPKLATTLLNDLFGIQSRAGCSCAGPYGHRLLDIDNETSERYRQSIREGYFGIKPGWCRLGCKRPAVPPVVFREARALLLLFRRDSRWRRGMGRNSGESILKPGVEVI
ncbi:MAG: aminotransferase class V-fold PLP-dependent enzyme, partial [Gammaproteobacteria bacterium]|nr:aminotransferase class V-fold PLP-dependent enzyme [Gammaproteobacteria bacterium]